MFAYTNDFFSRVFFFVYSFQSEMNLGESEFLNALHPDKFFARLK